MKCKETVLVRDTLRYTGRGRGGFEMHYRERQCPRDAWPNGYCWQHPASYPNYLKAAEERKR